MQVEKTSGENLCAVGSVFVRDIRKRCVNGCDLAPPGDVPPVIGFTGLRPTCTRSLGVQCRAHFNAILGAMGGAIDP